MSNFCNWNKILKKNCILDFMKIYCVDRGVGTAYITETKTIRGSRALSHLTIWNGYIYKNPRITHSYKHLPFRPKRAKIGSIRARDMILVSTSWYLLKPGNSIVQLKTTKITQSHKSGNVTCLYECVISGFFRCTIEIPDWADTFRHQNQVSSPYRSDFGPFRSKWHMFVWVCDCLIFGFL